MEDKIVLWGVTVSGSELLLGTPFSMELKKDRGAAHLLKVVFPAVGMWENIRRIYGFQGEENFFTGIVDEQATRYDSGGVQAEIIARGLSALLLDNEVMPQTIRNPSLGFLSRHFLEPLGFWAVSGKTEAMAGELIVKKGTSVMGLIQQFCGDFLGTRPFAAEDGSVYCGGNPQGRTHCLSRLLQWEVWEKNCEIISEVYGMNSVSGAYSAQFVNPHAAGILRRRYVTNPGKADFTVRRLIRAEVPEFLDAGIFDRVVLPEGIRGTVAGVKITGDRDGYTTVITAEEI